MVTLPRWSKRRGKPELIFKRWAQVELFVFITGLSSWHYIHISFELWQRKLPIFAHNHDDAIVLPSLGYFHAAKALRLLVGGINVGSSGVSVVVVLALYITAQPLAQSRCAVMAR